MFIQSLIESFPKNSIKHNYSSMLNLGSMKMTKFTESKIVTILKDQEGGPTVQDISREYDISQATFFNWKSKYGGMKSSRLKKLKELEDENQKLKRMYADVSLQRDALKDLIEKSLKACAKKSGSRTFARRA